MLKQKIVFLGLILVLVAIPLIACAQEAPAPAPAPMPAPAPTVTVTAPAPAPMPEPTTGPREITHAPVEIQISAGRVNAPWYPLCEAIAYYVNQDSDFVKLSAAVSPGMGAARQIIIDDPTATIGALTGGVPKQMPQQEQFNYYDKIKWMFGFAPTTWTYVTYDENIKTMSDLKPGMNVGVSRSYSSWGDVDEIIKVNGGPLDQLNLHREGMGGVKDALINGQLDMTYILLDHVYPTAISKGAYIQQMETKGPVYYVDLDPQPIIDLSTGPDSFWQGMPVRVFPGQLDPTTQPEELTVAYYPTMIGVDSQMDKEIVYEITRIAYEHGGEYSRWHVMGGNLSKQFIATYAFADRPEDVMHPGALEFFRDIGVEPVNVSTLLPF